MLINSILRNILFKTIYGYRNNSKTYIDYLKKRGMKAGHNCRIFNPETVFIDPSRPYMIELGNNVEITKGVTILTHGFDWIVLKVKYGDVLGSCGKVKIGNNVFIGMNSTILKNVTIGDNVIIGANSLVSKSIPNNCVAAGNPARVLCSIDEYYKKRESIQMEECSTLVSEYYNTFNKYPDSEILSEFFQLYENSNSYKDNEFYFSQMKQGNNLSFSELRLKNKKTKFSSKDQLIEYIIAKKS